MGNKKVRLRIRDAGSVKPLDFSNLDRIAKRRLTVVKFLKEAGVTFCYAPTLLVKVDLMPRSLREALQYRLKRYVPGIALLCCVCLSKLESSLPAKRIPRILPRRMENQVISKRYIKKRDLDELLGRLFGLNYFLEVGHQRVLRPSLP